MTESRPSEAGAGGGGSATSAPANEPKTGGCTSALEHQCLRAPLRVSNQWLPRTTKSVRGERRRRGLSPRNARTKSTKLDKSPILVRQKSNLSWTKSNLSWTMSNPSWTGYLKDRRPPGQVQRGFLTAPALAAPGPPQGSPPRLSFGSPEKLKP